MKFLKDPLTRMKIPMGSINRFRAIAAALILACLGLPLYAQENGSALLSAEMESIQKALQSPELSAASRRDAFTRMARFLTLTGNLEGAADAWFKAAALPEGWDAMCLLQGARCLAALGQFDAAEDHVRNILLAGNVQGAQLEARYLGAQIHALKTGNGAILASLLMNGEYTERRPSMLYTLWRITGDKTYKIRLETEYPASPEARILLEDSVGQVLGASAAMWLLLPGREGIVLGEPIMADGSLREAITAPASSTAESPILQTGLFRSEENTRVLAERLKKAGFIPLINRRMVSGTEYWTVGVSPGKNIQDTILQLKNAGFESFPVY
ncbi:MAG: hypothetical protein LBU18_01345 [Treponema sp.]|jgi:tetratricopeptide (TPR) repeat protein|nr:hypothetical protein [Treponema sp.]